MTGVDDALFTTTPTSGQTHDEPTDDGPTDQAVVAKPWFADVFAFVDGYLVHTYARQTTGPSAMRWCPAWHRHPEAVARLTAMWRAFEELRLDPGAGPSSWWLNHVDPMMAALTTPDGPFRECGPTQHRLQPLLPTVPPDATDLG